MAGCTKDAVQRNPAQSWALQALPTTPSAPWLPIRLSIAALTMSDQAVVSSYPVSVYQYIMSVLHQHGM